LIFGLLPNHGVQNGGVFHFDCALVRSKASSFLRRILGAADATYKHLRIFRARWMPGRKLTT